MSTDNIVNNITDQPCASLNLFEAMQKSAIEYVYIGEFTTSITDSILSLAELNLETSNDSIKLKKRVYFILVEGLQNITRHQQYDPQLAQYSGLLVIQRFDDTFVITTANHIANEDIPKIKSHIDKINSLDPKELKEYYREILAQQHFSSKGGAGLGLIEIARKSGNKLLYSFDKINDQYSIFYLQTIIALPNTEITETLSKETLENIKQIHKYFIKCNIVLSFAGIFFQDKLVYMLSILEKRMTQDMILRGKLFNIIVELLQNVVRHADDYIFNDIAGHYAIFYIAEDPENLYITTGNYIHKDKIPSLRDKLEFINALSIKGLTKEHYRILREYKDHGSEIDNLGLGLIDIRLKSKQKIRFDFDEVDDQYAFFSIEIQLKKFSQSIEDLEIPATETTPHILFSAQKAKFVIEGDSFPIDAIAFYTPVMEWLDQYAKSPRNFTIIHFKLNNFNTPTEKAIIQIINRLEQLSNKSVVIIKWYANPYDDSSIQFFNELKELYPNMELQLIKTEPLS